MDNTGNRPFQLRLNTKQNPKPFASLLQNCSHNQSSSQESAGQVTQRRWMEPNGLRASPAAPSSQMTEPQPPLPFRFQNTAPASDNSADDHADDSRPSPSHRNLAGTHFTDDKSPFEELPPLPLKALATHSRSERSTTPHSAAPFTGLRAHVETDQAYELHDRESRLPDRNRIQSLGMDLSYRMALMQTEAEETLRALREEAEENKQAAFRLSRLLKERERDLDAKKSALAELQDAMLAKDAEHVKQVQALQARLEESTARLSTFEGENGELQKRLLDTGDRLMQATKAAEDSERRTKDAERRCEQVLRDGDTRAALLTQQADNVGAEARAQVEEARQEAQNIKDEAKKRMHDLKTSMRKKVEGLTEKFSELSSSFAAAQAYRTSWDARAGEIELGVQDLQVAVRSALAAIQPIMTADSGVLKLVETREVIQELQADRANANQVIDMLRDKLHVVSSQLVDAKDRIAELERMLAKDKHRVQSSVHELSRIGMCGKVEEVAVQLTNRERQASKAFDEVEQTAYVLGTANAKIEDLTTVLVNRDAELAALRPLAKERESLGVKCDLQAAELVQLASLRDERAHLAAQLATLKQTMDETSRKLQTSDARVSDLEHELLMCKSRLRANEESKEALQVLQRERQSEMVKVQDKYEDCLAKEVELRTEKASLEQELNAKFAECDDLLIALRSERDKLDAVHADAQRIHERLDHEHDAEVRALDSSVQQLRERAAAAEALVQYADSRLRRAGAAQSVSLSRLADSEQSLNIARKELEECVGPARAYINFAESTSFQTLRARYDAQTETLRACNLERSQLQARLTEAEICSSAATARAQAEIDRRAAAEAALLAANDRLASHSESSAAVDERLVQQEQAHSSLVRTLMERAETAEQEATQARIEANAQKEAVTQLMARVPDKERNPTNDITAKDAALAKLADAEAKLAILADEVADLKDKSVTLCERYQDNRLTSQEKVSIKRILGISISSHQQEMIAKENELRRRENTIVGLKKELGSVQVHLARALREQRHEEVPVQTVATQSYFNLNAFMPSSPHKVEGVSSTPFSGAKRTTRSPIGRVIDSGPTLPGTSQEKSEEAKPLSAARTPIGPPPRRPLTPKQAPAPRKPFSKIAVDTEEEDTLSPIEDSDDGDDYVPLAAKGSKGKGKGKALLGKRTRSGDSASPVKPVPRKQRTTTAGTTAAAKPLTSSQTENKPTRQRRRR
ncbi:hypothetical protein HDZ31DRAFT_39313 [Schizophyllum fasciatum]